MHNKWQKLLPQLNAFLKEQRENGNIERKLAAEIKIKSPAK
jgi:hypothetical protein